MLPDTYVTVLILDILSYGLLEGWYTLILY